MEKETNLLNDPINVLHNAFGPLFIAAVLLFIALGYLKRRGPESSLKPFDREHSLYSMLRTAVSISLSRWWLIGIPIIFGIDKLNFDDISRYRILKSWTYHGIGDPTAHISFLDSVKALFTLESWIVIFWYVVSDSGQNIKGISAFGNIPFSPLMWTMAAWAVLYWFKRTSKNHEGPLEKLHKFQWKYLVIVLASLTLLLLLSPLLILTILDQTNGPDVLGGIVLLGSLSVFASPIYISLWFSAVYVIVFDWDSKSSEMVISNDLESLTFQNFFIVFPVLLIISIVFFILYSISTVLVSFNHFMMDFLINHPVLLSFLKEPYGFRLIMDLLMIVFAWLIFPLPVLAVRYNVGIRDGVKLSIRTWTHNFRRLVTLIVVCLTFYAILSGILGMENIVYQGGISTWPANEHLWPYKLIKMLIIPLESFVTVVCFIFILLAFQTGSLDLPEEMSGNDEEGNVEDVEE
jgi:hypothetical protein